MIKINFKINEDYLITFVLSNTKNHRFSSPKYKKDIKAFQSYAQKESKLYNNLLVKKTVTNTALQSVLRGKIQKHKGLKKFLLKLKKSKQYKKILNQTQNYLQFCKKEWQNNHSISSKIIRGITGLKLNKAYRVYITHPGLKNGAYLGNNLIEWGNNERWSNYTMVYLWHEILHSYIGWSDVEHAIIELITDEELRSKLNSAKYPPFIGHKSLNSLKRKILPYWQKYLKSKNPDIKKFIKEMNLVFKSN